MCKTFTEGYKLPLSASSLFFFRQTKSMADLAAMKRIDPKKAAANAFYKWRHKTRKNRGILSLVESRPIRETVAVTLN